jgi:aspartyl/glutamyl-tRNA(Asn/Gln) amidotransferase C subunit
MATPDEVKKLAILARIEVPEKELKQFTKDFDAILAYVGQLEKLNLPEDLTDKKPPLRNVFRKDENPTAPETWTQKLTQAFPKQEKGALSVKQIISHD